MTLDPVGVPRDDKITRGIQYIGVIPECAKRMSGISRRPGTLVAGLKPQIRMTS